MPAGGVSYAVTPLPLPRGATHCTATGINNSQQMVGTCHTPASDRPQTAYWSSPTSPPTLLTLTGNARNAGTAINDRGHITFAYRDTRGELQSGYWDPAGSIAFIPSLTGGSACSVAGLGANDTVALNCETADQHTEAAEWSPSSGTTTPLGFEDGGSNDVITSVNKSGTAAALAAETSSQNTEGGEVSL